MLSSANPALPMFDIDDLSFFRVYGVGLRHAELELGMKEAVEGGYGDAICLGGYGRGGSKDAIFQKPSFTLATCNYFQQEVEKFVLHSFEGWHARHRHFVDAAFLLINRGNLARTGYDQEHGYSLGKGGSGDFAAKDVLALITSDQYVCDDAEHAVLHVLTDLKKTCQQLKLKYTKLIAEQLKLEGNIEAADACNKLLALYEKDCFLLQPYFLTLAAQCRALPTDYFPSVQDQLHTPIAEWFKDLNENDKKGKSTIEVIYQPLQLDSLTPQQLSERLIHYIKNQNKEKVVACLNSLKQSGFNPEKSKKIESPLQTAAMHEDVTILQAVYEFNPREYDDLVANDQLATPLFLAAKKLNLANVKYLLSVRKITPRDVSIFNRDHILEEAVTSSTPEALEIVKILLNLRIDINCVTSLENPIARAARGFDPDHELNQSSSILALLLPHANAWSKYVAILNCTNELVWCYPNNARDRYEYKDPRINKLFQLRRMILASLSPEECLNIYRYYYTSSYVVSRSAENSLLLDLLMYELREAEPHIAANLRACFTPIAPRAADKVANQPATHFATTQRRELTEVVVEKPTTALESGSEAESASEESRCALI